jgi:hypothetical protein
MADGDRQFVTVWDSLPSALDDGLNRPLRGTRYGEAVTMTMGKAALAYADEGTYFIAKHPTVATGVAGIAAADGAEGLENLLYIENAHATKKIYLDYLRLTTTAAGTNGTTTQFVSAISPTARYTSGGSTITPINVNAGGSATSAIVRFGACVTTAVPAAGAILDDATLRSVITVAGDVYHFDFGGYGHAINPLVTTGTAVVKLQHPHPAVVLEPGACFTLQIYAASQSAASSFLFTLGFVER